MRAKDAARLAVLRAVFATTLNASKTTSPITTDVQLVALLRRTARTSQEAVAKFRSAGRQDLVDKEEAQIQVLEEYAAGSGVQAIDEADMRRIVQQVISEHVANGTDAMGQIMKILLAPEGPLAGNSFDKSALNTTVKEVLQSARERTNMGSLASTDI